MNSPTSATTMYTSPDLCFSVVVRLSSWHCHGSHSCHGGSFALQSLPTQLTPQHSAVPSQWRRVSLRTSLNQLTFLPRHFSKRETHRTLPRALQWFPHRGCTPSRAVMVVFHIWGGSLAYFSVTSFSNVFVFVGADGGGRFIVP